MTTTSSTSTHSDRTTLTSDQLASSVRLFEIKPGKKVPELLLQQMLPDVETALFFAKAYSLPMEKLTELLWLLFKTNVITALLGEGAVHSSDLQDYIVDTVPDEILAEHGSGHYDETRPVPDSELLAQLWEQANVEIADSIATVAEKIGSVLDMLPSKYGTMTFQHLSKLNKQRRSLGTYAAQIQHPLVAPRLVVLDVSGSMRETTIRSIVDEVVALAYKANASLAIVSNTARLYDMGTFDTATVLRDAEYGGTYYEQLAPIFDQDWETVITIADYDSSRSAQDAIRRNARGRIQQVLDISLVDRPTFLSECLGVIAAEVRPLLIGRDSYTLMR